MAASIYTILAFGLGSFGSFGQCAIARQGRAALPPVVAVKNGSYSGVYSPEYNQEYFLGMPYAQPPARFSLAQVLNTSWTDTRAATTYPKHCVGYGSDQIGFEVSEDCLYLNVVRPAGISDSAGLPVAVWIHGGGLFMGGSADQRYNLSYTVQNSVELGTPIIGVSINYRLSAFGFVSSREALEEGVTNLGFRDQRLALHWVNENIEAFGGASDKVTIYGESSGAESVSAQVLAYNGRDDGLFRAAIGQSGFGGTLYRYPGGFNNTDAPQDIYNQLVQNTSCASTVNTPASLDCLRGLSFEEINSVLNGTGPWPPAIDGDFIADFPYLQLRDGKFPRIPLLIGANTDEGTAFGSGRGPNGAGASSTDEVAAAFRQTISPGAADTTGKSADDLLAEALYVYPNIQAVGIPSLDKLAALKPGDPLAAVIGLQGRRTQAYFGDLFMHYCRRRANIAWASYGVPSYSYRFDITQAGNPAWIGAIHFTEVAYVFDNILGTGYTSPPIVDDADRQVAKAMSTAWINFIAGLDPNGGAPSGVVWPAYDPNVGGGVGQNLVWSTQGSGTFVEIDSYRSEGINWFINNALSIFGN
ncbi:alpha/beta-hydrolase [Thozetella sp. PMI_491]|nr:alpha/beta-hydrolase [Thozetella sp. PMI_491]